MHSRTRISHGWGWYTRGVQCPSCKPAAEVHFKKKHVLMLYYNSNATVDYVPDI